MFTDSQLFFCNARYKESTRDPIELNEYEVLNYENLTK